MTREAAAVLSYALRTDHEPCSGEANVAEEQRTALIAAIVSVVRHEQVPVDVQRAALTLVGWLARRHLVERPCTRGVVEARKQNMSLGGGRR